MLPAVGSTQTIHRHSIFFTFSDVFYSWIHPYPPVSNPQDLTNTLEEAELHIVWFCLWGRSWELRVKLVAAEETGETLEELWQRSLASDNGVFPKGKLTYRLVT